MRITGGEFGGRNLLVPKSDAIRPTQDRVREALFSILQTEIPDCDFLDLFAGSGAVGLEALSRGAKSATFVESNRRHVSVLKRNVAECLVPGAEPGVPVAERGVPGAERGVPGAERGVPGAWCLVPGAERGVSGAWCLVPGAERGVPGAESRHQAPSAKHQIIVADCYRWIATYAGPGFTVGFADPPYALGEEKGYATVLATLAERGVIRPGGLFVAEMTAVQKAEETPGWELLRDRTYGKTRLCVWRRAIA